MMIILNILKAFVVLVYAFFLLDANLAIKYDMFDESSQDKGNLSWIDWIYFIYTLSNFILVIRFLYR